MRRRVGDSSDDLNTVDEYVHGPRTTLLAKPADFWTDRAAQQIWLTDYLLDYRWVYYPNGAGGYSVYQAPLLPWEASDDLDCTGG